MVVEHGVRFYCGTPLIGANGHRLGTLCFVDDKPRKMEAHECMILANLCVPRNHNPTKFTRHGAKFCPPYAEVSYHCLVAVRARAKPVNYSSPCRAARMIRAHHASLGLGCRADMVVRELERDMACQAVKQQTNQMMLRALDCLDQGVCFVDTAPDKWQAMHCNSKLVEVSQCFEP